MHRRLREQPWSHTGAAPPAQAHLQLARLPADPGQTLPQLGHAGCRWRRCWPGGNGRLCSRQLSLQRAQQLGQAWCARRSNGATERVKARSLAARLIDTPRHGTFGSRQADDRPLASSRSSAACRVACEPRLAASACWYPSRWRSSAPARPGRQVGKGEHCNITQPARSSLHAAAN